MADERRQYDLDELLIRPGTYFNPQTEVLVVVDDSPSLDQEIFNMEPFEGADWVLIADETPIDEPQRDVMLESFQATYGGADGRLEETDTDEDVDRLEPDELDEADGGVELDEEE